MPTSPSKRERKAIYDKQYRKAHHEQFRARMRTYEAQKRKRERDFVLQHYGPACACCGEAHDEFLTIDHMNGGGNQHRREIGSRLYHWLIRKGYPEGYRVLCMNCNFAVGKSGHCPHEAKKE